jgi:hypothetical protein
MRLYTWNGYSSSYIDTVNVNNCSGTLSEAAFLIGLANGSNLNSIDALTISDCNLTAPTILAFAENFGTIALNRVTFVPSQSNVVWVSPQANTICAFARPSPLYGNITSAGSSLTFNDCKISRKADMEVAAVILENNSTIGYLEFNGFELQDSGSYSSVPELLRIGSESVAQLVIDSLDSNNIKTALAVGQFSRIGSVSGAGVLSTKWEFPDAVMAEEIPYISANSGLPSIKIDGVVELYSQT